MGNQPFISKSSRLTVPAWKSTLSIFMRRPSMVSSMPRGMNSPALRSLMIS